ncbi:MAG: MBL fold metallo-hydrolase RNA specificity domain-containing protein, partial [Candidatus Bathyarchaeia archaeon]
HRFEFSSHAGRAELQQMAKNLRGSPEVYVVHGSEKSCVDMAEWVNKEIGLKAMAPSAGDVFKL